MIYYYPYSKVVVYIAMHRVKKRCRLIAAISSTIPFITGQSGSVIARTGPASRNIVSCPDPLRRKEKGLVNIVQLHTMG